MEKLIKEYEVKFVDVAAAFDKEDFEQLVGTGVVTEVKHGDALAVDKVLDEASLAALMQVNDESGNFELNLAGLGQFVQVTGATQAFLTDKRDVKDVSGKGLPVPAVINDVIRLDNKKI